MKKSAFLILVLITIILSGCSGKHLIYDKAYRAKVDSIFRIRKNLASGRNQILFDVFNKKLSVSQTEALKFLFAFMPLNDLADYSGEFFLANADIALNTRMKSSWGKMIPDNIFLHYILPCRVNNENLDSFRIIYHDELSERIKGYGLKEAALEINHWCHEKVTYQPSDIRTSGPMSTILSARGRCGEESTLTVNALRAVGIPARQVYTPRWAHSDDNHAWVEIWNDGSWYYMGACEPESGLDQGWFTEPARRAMLIHTKSFGAYYGKENYINRHNYYSEINNLSKYAVTKRIFVKVTDIDNLPVDNALVEFQLYNYAEFYPLAIVPTNISGICSFETGLGDLLIWARKNNDFNFSKISVAETDTLLLKIDRKPTGSYRVDYDLPPPVQRTPLQGPSEEKVKINAERLLQENAIREAYIKSWITKENAASFARKMNLNEESVTKCLSQSMGNYRSIIAFLSEIKPQDKDNAIELLKIISEKDLRDTKDYILKDHLNNVLNPFYIDSKNELFINYILNPRVSNEMLIPYRGFLISSLTPEFKSEAVRDPSSIIKYIDDSIRILNDENYYKVPLTPKGVHELKLSDSKSRAIYFVALCRSLGIPSRLEPGSNIPQYWFNSKWNDVYFSDQAKPTGEKGFLKLSSEDNNPVPEYYIHFTLARFENGRYNTLEYDYNKRITEFRDELALTPGHYMIVTGNRLDDSNILTNISFLDIFENQHVTHFIKLRKKSSVNKYLGSIDIEKLLNEIPGKITSRDFDKGLVLIWLEPEKEPSKHVINDLPLLKKEFDNIGINFYFFSINPQFNHSILNNINGLPSHSHVLTDQGSGILKKIGINTDLKEITYPFLILSDKDGRILYKSSGYRIGIGEQILKRLREQV